MSSYYSGNLRADATRGSHRGWVVGSAQFITDPAHQTEALEVKYWEYPKGPTDHDAKTSDTVEWTYLLKGRTKATVDGRELELKAGDYILIQPGTPNNTVAEILEDAQGITVKAPSDPSAKHVIE